MITLEPERVASARQGGRQALQALVSSLQRAVFNLVIRMLGHKADAEDATQEILIRSSRISERCVKKRLRAPGHFASPATVSDGLSVACDVLIVGATNVVIAFVERGKVRTKNADGVLDGIA